MKYSWQRQINQWKMMKNSSETCPYEVKQVRMDTLIILFYDNFSGNITLWFYYLVFVRKLNILECLVKKRQGRGLRRAENKESVRMTGFCISITKKLAFSGKHYLTK